MLQNNKVPNVARYVPCKRISFNILCGVSSLEQWIISTLEAAGFQYEQQSTLTVLIDAPQGFALRQLEMLAGMQLQIIVMSGNPCAEYWEDVWELQPAALLVGECLRGELEAAHARVAHGERYRITPGHVTVLTRTERMMLRYLARGWTIEQIATGCVLSPKTVDNRRAIMYEKLHLSTPHSPGRKNRKGQDYARGT
jgi:DNA-binding NarL/FixJ family response regulator